MQQPHAATSSRLAIKRNPRLLQNPCLYLFMVDPQKIQRTTDVVHG